jgi:hypothetical protein
MNKATFPRLHLDMEDVSVRIAKCFKEWKRRAGRG